MDLLHRSKFLPPVAHPIASPIARPLATPPSADPYSIGNPGEMGFGVGVCPEEYLPPGMARMPRCFNLFADNYGNYRYADGSIMVFVPKFYYKITAGTNNVDVKGTDTYRTTAAANAAGYALHRVFIDGGVEQPGFFVDKYKCSANTWGAGTIGSSIKNGDPISTHAGHNPIVALTACGTNAYFEVIDAAHARDGVNGAVNPSSIFFAGSRFIHSALAILSLAHGQASVSTTNCAWYHTTYNYPKGCNNNALGDINDPAVSYTWDGYSNCGKTGSGTPFAKTTHNGQNCGVADINGLMWEIALGFTCITAGGGTIEDISRVDPANVQITGHGLSTNDYIMLANIEGGDWAALDDKLYKIVKVDNDNFTLNGVDASGFTLAYVAGTNHGTITAGVFYLAKEATAMKDFTSGNTAATDHWGATGVATMMESFTPAFETSYAVNGFAQRYGSGANQVLSEAINGANWKLTGLALPKDANGIDTAGTNEFGKDYYYQYIRNQLCGRSFGDWSGSSGAGVWFLPWNGYRTASGYSVGWRSACYPL